MKEKIHYKPVLTALQNIIEQTKKKTDATAACTELEEKIQELLESETENTKEVDSHLMPPPSIMPKKRRNVRRSKYKNKNDETDEDSSEDDSEEDVNNASIVKCE